jgi:hypothetical protein
LKNRAEQNSNISRDRQAAQMAPCFCALRRKVMRPWFSYCLGGLVLSTLAGFVVAWQPEQPPPPPRIVPGPVDTADVYSAAEALGLHWISDPPGRQPPTTLYLSSQPITGDDLESYWMHYPDLERWRGVVRVGLHARFNYRSNFDAATAERFAMWGAMFLYGDPDLITKLLSYQPAQPWRAATRP